MIFSSKCSSLETLTESKEPSISKNGGICVYQILPTVKCVAPGLTTKVSANTDPTVFQYKLSTFLKNDAKKASDGVHNTCGRELDTSGGG